MKAVTSNFTMNPAERRGLMAGHLTLNQDGLGSNPSGAAY